jgi:hypothetical protein
MVAELLRCPFGATRVPERRDGSGNGLPDLTGTGFVGALERRREQGAGLEGGDVTKVHRWPHLGLLCSTALCRKSAGRSRPAEIRDDLAIASL